MTALKGLFVCSLLVISSIVYPQTNGYMFNHFKTTGDKTQVYFKIENLNNDKETQDQVLEVLLQDEKISDGNIYSVDEKSATCHLEIDPSVSVDYIRNLLQSTGYDIDLTSLTPKNPGKPEGLYGSEKHSFFEGFDGLKNYNPNNQGSLSAEEHYQKEKEAWIKENPEAYNKAKQQSGTTVIVKKKDLETFTQQKREHILSHPEIFIVED